MTDQELLSEFQYVLLEPINDGGQSWVGEVWNRDEVIDALNGSERNLLRQAFLLVTRVELTVAVGAVSVDLPADWLASLHLVWRDTSSGLRTPLGPGDTFGTDLALPTWQILQGTPLVYMDLDQTTLTFRLGPVPSSNGVIELLYVANPTPVNGNNRSFTVSDDYIDGIKYGALEALLSKVGRLQDPERTAYARQRVGLVETISEIILKGWP